MPRIPTGVVKVKSFDFEANLADALARKPQDNYNHGIKIFDPTLAPHKMKRHSSPKKSPEFYGDLRTKILHMHQENPDASKVGIARALNCSPDHVRAVLHRFGKS
jgi:hypothetical protein